MQEETQMTHLVSQKNAAGSQSNRNGISILSNETEVENALEQLTHLLRYRKGSQQEVQALADALSQPADKQWVLARIAATLSPYYEKDVPNGVKMIEAEDWLEAMSGYPQWAITKAVRWWKSAENDRRKVRPLEGDIVARIKVEMDAVNAATKYKNSWHSFGFHQEPKRERVSAARAAEIMEQAGFKPRKMTDD